MTVSFKKGHCLNADGEPLEWIHVERKPSMGVVFLPPLIGGNAAQQIKVFRPLVKSGFDLFSFSYAGHGGSSGKFSLSGSLTDTESVLKNLGRMLEGRELPIFGAGVCYSAIPLLNAAFSQKLPLSGLVLVNALTGIELFPVIRSFASYYKRFALYAGSFLKIREAFTGYLNFLFPGVVKEKGFFGALDRRRVNLRETARDLFSAPPLKGVRLPEVPVISLYAMDDRILEIFDGGRRSSYERDILDVCPEASFMPMDGDHYLSSPESRKKTLELIRNFLVSQVNGHQG